MTIRELASKAMPGPWEFVDGSGNQFVTDFNGHAICALPGVFAKTNEFRFIAAMSPELAIAYEDCVEALRKALPKLRDEPEYNSAKYALAALDAVREDK